jgi:hypothetical protein
VRLHYFRRGLAGVGQSLGGDGALTRPRRGERGEATRRGGVATESTLPRIQRPHGGASDASLASGLTAAALSSAPPRLFPTPARALGLHPFRCDRCG